MHSLQQLISSPTHLLPNSSSCINLIFTDQPDLVVDSGVYSAFHVKRHHQSIHCKFNLMIVYPPAHKRLVWDFKRTNTDAIINSINQVDWEILFFNENMYQQFNIFNKTLMNDSSNCIPNKYITCTDKDPHWMTIYLKYKIHCKNSLYLKYLKHGKKNCEYNELQKSSEEVSEVSAIFKIKELYHVGLEKLNKPKASRKTYWAIMETFYGN